MLKAERCGFLSEKPQGWAPSAAAASGAAPTAEQGDSPSTATAPRRGRGRSAHAARAQYLATGGCMKTKKGRHEAPDLPEQVHQEDGRTQEKSCRKLSTPQLQQN